MESAELKKLIGDEIQKTENKANKTIRDKLVIAALEGDKKRLERIEKILNVEKYDLVFIGQQGVGKTTAICHLFGLTTDKKVKIKKGKNTLERTVVQELLSTGSGKTTICEVAIVPDETTFIEVEPFSDKDLKELIDDFCSFQWDKWQQKNNHSSLIPAELMRAVKNMAKLKSTEELNELLEKAEEQEDFDKAIWARSRISERTETKIIPPIFSFPDDEKNWVRKTFHQLNFCQLDNFSIPKRISLHLRKELLSNLADFSKFNSIVDTKGIGAGEFGKDRPDIDKYIQSEEAFCLMAELFGPAPENVIDLMKYYLTPESQDISSKISLFVVPHKNEPEKMPGAEGTREDGIKRRKEDIEERLVAQKVNFSQDNIVFYDPLMFYVSEGTHGFRRDPDYEKGEFKELVASEKQRILSEIQALIEKRKQALVEERETLAQHLEEIKAGKGINESDEYLIAEMRKKIVSEYKVLPIRARDADDFIHDYVNAEVVNRHHMTVRAINNGYGRYEVRGIDIFHNAVPKANSLLRQIAQSRKDAIVVEVIKRCMEEASPDLQVLLRNFESQINAEYNDFLRKFSQEVSSFLEESVFRQDYFWPRTQNRWGEGPGYKADIGIMYRDQLTNHAKHYFEDKIKEHWQNFVKIVLTFLQTEENVRT
jgi:hypothetical protein